MNSSCILLKYFTSWITVKFISSLHSCHPCSCSCPYVSLRFHSSSLTWPPGLLSTSIEIYSSCRDFSNLYTQLCQSSAQTLQLYIYHCQDEACACQQLTCRVSQLSCLSLTMPCPALCSSSIELPGVLCIHMLVVASTLLSIPVPLFGMISSHFQLLDFT